MELPTPTEFAVLDVLWEYEIATARDIAAWMYPAPERSQHGTVQRLLARLERKRLVERIRDPETGRQAFQPAVGPVELAVRAVEATAYDFQLGSLTPIVVAWLRTRPIADHEAALIRAALPKQAEPHARRADAAQVP